MHVVHCKQQLVEILPMDLHPRRHTIYRFDESFNRLREIDHVVKFPFAETYAAPNVARRADHVDEWGLGVARLEVV